MQSRAVEKVTFTLCAYAWKSPISNCPNIRQGTPTGRISANGVNTNRRGDRVLFHRYFSFPMHIWTPSHFVHQGLQS